MDKIKTLILTAWGYLALCYELTIDQWKKDGWRRAIIIGAVVFLGLLTFSAIKLSILLGAMAAIGYLIVWGIRTAGGKGSYS